VDTRTGKLEKLLSEGSERLLKRATDTRSLKPGELVGRVGGAVDKYLLKFDPDAKPENISTFIDELQADDLCLIIACEKGDENAWNELVERFTPTVRSAARSASANEDAAEDLAQSIWAELFGLRNRKDGKSSSKLAYYSGRGSLAGWLRAVVAQLAVDTYRKQSRLVQTEEESDLERLSREAVASDGQPVVASLLQNPEQAVSNRYAEIDLQVALRQAVQELAPDDRLLVKLYYFDGLRLREAGAVLGVHEATASRRLTKVQNELRKAVTEILVKEKGWTKAETEKSFAELAQTVDADLETLLTKEQV
jgi:RNA polymerase sigma-70 factor (ECF subfamily)